MMDNFKALAARLWDHLPSDIRAQMPDDYRARWVEATAEQILIEKAVAATLEHQSLVSACVRFIEVMTDGPFHGNLQKWFNDHADSGTDGSEVGSLTRIASAAGFEEDLSLELFLEAVGLMKVATFEKNDELAVLLEEREIVDPAALMLLVRRLCAEIARTPEQDEKQEQEFQDRYMGGPRDSRVDWSKMTVKPHGEQPGDREAGILRARISAPTVLDRTNPFGHARKIMIEAFQNDDDLWRGYRDNIAMVLHDRHGITAKDKRDHAAADIMNLIFDTLHPPRELRDLKVTSVALIDHCPLCGSKWVCAPCECSTISEPHYHMDDHTVVPWDVFEAALEEYRAKQK